MAMMQVVSAIDACSAANTEASLKASIAQGVTNKDLSDQAIFSPYKHISRYFTSSFFPGCCHGSQ